MPSTRYPAFVAFFISTLFAQTSPPNLVPGTVVPSIPCQKNHDQTYALYLPSNFTATRKWPIIYVFDPNARGELAVETIRTAAEKFGYIVAASNNSRNGPMGGSMQAADAMWDDTQRRFPIDENRRYLSGMSGGARVATAIALGCHCVAGVIGNAAGFQPNTALSKGLKFSYFATVGNADFNYPEFFHLRKDLDQAGARYRISIFDGAHGWAPPAVWDEALSWMDLQAMSAGTMPRDAARIRQTLADETKRAEQMIAGGDWLGAARLYESIARDFGGLTDTAAANARLAEIHRDKRYKQNEREEQEDVSRQQQMTSEPSASLQKIDEEGIEAVELAELKGAFIDLAERAASTASDRKTLVARRANAQLHAEAYEDGEDSLRRKNYQAALAYFEIALVGSKHPEWLHYQRARVFAAMANSKAVISELKLALASGLDDPGALEDMEFTSFRSLPEFQALREQLKTK
ncbi:MAG TPA: hypothetical protein VGF06_15395 [Terriglobales bacterium]